MPVTYSVTLPRTRIARFPDCCVVCNAPEPGKVHGWNALESKIPISLFELIPLGSDKVKAIIPACPACHEALLRRRWILGIGEIVSVVIPVLIALPFIKKYVPADKGIIVVIAVGILGVLPIVFYRYQFPSPFGARLMSTRQYEAPNVVEYRFRDLDYAEAFAALNKAEVD